MASIHPNPPVEENSAIRVFRLQNRLLPRVYESLTWNDKIQSADLIFVMAGRVERKPYGLELYQAGIAPRLVLSIGRFEVSKIRQLPIECLHRLIALRDKTQPHERHFFVRLENSNTHIQKVELLSWNTYGELLALRDVIEKERLRRVIIVSTDLHLRRVRVTCCSIFRDTPVEFFLLCVALESRSRTKGSFLSV